MTRDNKPFAYFERGESFKLEEDGILYMKTGTRTGIDSDGNVVEVNTRQNAWVPSENDLKPKSKATKKKAEKVVEEEREKREEREERWDNPELVDDFDDEDLDLDLAL